MSWKSEEAAIMRRHKALEGPRSTRTWAILMSFNWQPNTGPEWLRLRQDWHLIQMYKELEKRGQLR